MTNKLKNKRGFSLVELMVVVAIMGTLASIAIPAFNEYRKSAKKAAYRADLTSLHKSWLAFGVELDSFCTRDTDPDTASIVNVGMESLSGSKYYGDNPDKNNFIGFGAFATTNPCPGGAWTASTHIQDSNTSSSTALVINNVNTQIDANCTLSIVDYRMGVFGHVGGVDYFGLNIRQTGVVEDATARSSGNNPVAGAGDVANVCT